MIFNIIGFVILSYVVKNSTQVSNAKQENVEHYFMSHIICCHQANTLTGLLFRSNFSIVCHHN